MPTQKEKTAFSERLRHALHRREPAVSGPTRLAAQFSLRYLGAGISPQTAHKWLTGRAIPTPDKIATLAAWLGVSAHWLHYGPAPDLPFGAGPAVGDAYPVSSEALVLASRIDALPTHRRQLVRQLVAEFCDKDRP
jgi:transcriptional regulator with XRE-family HTH domain